MTSSPATRPPAWLLGAFAATLLVLGAVGVWLRFRPPVPSRDVESFLETVLESGRLRFTVVGQQKLDGPANPMRVLVTASGRAPEALYVKLDTADYLKRTFKADPGATEEARRLSDTSSEHRLLDPYAATVVQMASAEGATFDFQGVIQVTPAGGKNTIGLESGGYLHGNPVGEPLSAFRGKAFVAGNPADDARLEGALGDLKARADRLASERRNREASEASRRRSEFEQEMAPGRVFLGTAVEPGRDRGTTLYLEIASVSASGAVRALVRNEGGWHLARAFEGSWVADERWQDPVVTLSSPPSLAVPGAGALLEDAQTWSIPLHWLPGGKLTGSTRYRTFTFRLLDPATAAQVQSAIDREFTEAVQATEPGRLYIGTAISRSTDASEPILLRFAARSGGIDSVEASFESTTHAWRRAVHGAILANSKRSAGEPISLHLSASSAVEEAWAASLLGDPEDLDMRFATGGGVLTGGDASFTYRLVPATAEDLQRLEADRQERRKLMMRVLRPGVALDGVLHEEQGFRSQVRLEIDAFDPTNGTVSARFVSLLRSKVFRAFTGVIDYSGDTLVLTAPQRSKYFTDDRYDVPFLKTPAKATVRLTLSQGSFKGRIDGDSAWTIEVPLGVFFGFGGPQGPAPLASESYPPLPKADGAYVLVAGAWAPMPTNLGHVATETVGPESNLHLTLNVIDALDQGIGLVTRQKDKRTFAFLDFEGKDSRPVVSGQNVNVLFVGQAPSDKPSIELAEADLQKDGKRRVSVLQGPDGSIRFGESRAPAYVRTLAPNAVLLTATEPLEPGPYVLHADKGYELNCE